jgi:hypothetical protein
MVYQTCDIFAQLPKCKEKSKRSDHKLKKGVLMGEVNKMILVPKDNTSTARRGCCPFHTDLSSLRGRHLNDGIGAMTTELCHAGPHQGEASNFLVAKGTVLPRRGAVGAGFHHQHEPFKCGLILSTVLAIQTHCVTTNITYR